MRALELSNILTTVANRCLHNNPGFRGFAFGGMLVPTTSVALRDANLSFEIEVTIPAAKRESDRLALPGGPECMTLSMRLSGQ